MSDGRAPRSTNDLSSAATRVAEIVAAAERAAEELRTTAERRASERIAEADRAASMRVAVADEEAFELHDKAARQAREVLNEARAAARAVLHDGEEITGHLRELGDALRANAERLMRDVRLAHAELTSRLDQAEPRTADAGHYPTPSPAPAVRQVELDVPEFIPRSAR